MDKKTSNPCSRCGKERIIVRTYIERVGNSSVLNTITSCPDPDCQSEINKVLARDEKMRADMKLASERRLQEQKERRAETLKRA